jgi:hypothetical protein
MMVETIPSKSAGGNYGSSPKSNRKLVAKLNANIYVSNINKTPKCYSPLISQSTGNIY